MSNKVIGVAPLMVTAPLVYHRVADINLLVENEAWNSDVDIPKYPVESGVDVSDHVQKKSKVLTISGLILTDRKLSANVKINKLENMKDKGKLVPYYGRRNGTNLLIHKFTYQADAKIANGQRFTMVLEEVRFANKVTKSMVKTIKSKIQSTKKQVASKKPTTTTTTTTTNGIKYHTVKKGDTYIKIGKQYGTDWKQIKKWAGYADTKLPVGAKIRVK